MYIKFELAPSIVNCGLLTLDSMADGNASFIDYFFFQATTENLQLYHHINGVWEIGAQKYAIFWYGLYHFIQQHQQMVSTMNGNKEKKVWRQ